VICVTCGAEGARTLRNRLEEAGTPQARSLLSRIPPAAGSMPECDLCYEDTNFVLEFLARNPGSTERKVARALQRFWMDRGRTS